MLSFCRGPELDPPPHGWGLSSQLNLSGLAFVPAASAESRSLTSLKVCWKTSAGESQLLRWRPYESESESANEQQSMSVGGEGASREHVFTSL